MADEVDPIIADMRREQQEATTQYGKIPPASSTPVPKLEHPIDTSTDISVKSPTYQQALGHGQFQETPVQGYDASVANAPDFPPQPQGTGGSAAVDAAPADAPAADSNEDPVVAEMKAEQAKADAQAGALLDYRSKNDAMDAGRRGDVLRYSAASGLDPSFVEQNLDQVKRNVDAQKVDWNRVVQEQPALTEFMLNNPQTTPLVKDDAANLKGIEWGLSAPFHAFLDGLNEQRSIARQFIEAEGLGSEENRAKIRELDEKFANKDYGAENWFQKGLIGLGKAIPQVAGDISARLLGGYLGATAGAAGVGAAGATAGAPEGGVPAIPLGAAGAIVGGVGGATVGQFAGSGLFNYYETIGPLYTRLSQLKDANGEPLDPKVVQAFAQSGALITSGLMAGFFGKITTSLPGVKNLMSRFTSETVEKAAVDASVQALAKRGVSEFGKHWVTGATLMAAQSAVSAASEEGAKATSGQPFEAHWSNVGESAVQGFKSGLEDMWLLSALGPGREFLKDVGTSRASAESAVRLQGMAESAKESTLLKHFPEGFRDLVSTMKENPEAVKNVFIPAEEWATYFQEKNLDPGEVAAGVLGDQGKAYNEALTTKGDLVIPVEQFLSKLATSEHGDALLEHSKLAPDELTPRQFADQQKVVAERMKEAAQERAPELAEGKRAVGDFIREQAIEAGLGKEEATKNAELVANYATTMATRLGISVREAAALGSLGRLRVLGPKGEAVARAAQERFQEFLRPNASQFLERRLTTLSPENRGREYYVDPVSGLRNRRAFDATPQPEGKQVAVITSPDVKGINDHPTAGGHDVANDFLRQVGSALGEVDPEAARSGTNFLFHVDNQEQLDAAVKKVQAAIGNDKLHIVGGLGENVDKAFANTDAKTKTGRESGALPKRGELHPELDVGSLKFSEEKAKATVPEHLVGEISKLSDADYAKKVYQDRIETTDEDGKKVSMPTGLLTAEGWRAIPRKANVASLDARGLKLVNTALGERAGDRLLFTLADTLAHFGGSDFDVAHLSGDEFAAQHDDPVKLEAFVTRVKEALKTQQIEGVDKASGKWVSVGVEFRHGIGSDYGEADRDLNTRKRAEAGQQPQQPGAAQPRGAVADAAGTAGVEGNLTGGQVGVGAGSDVSGAAGADEEGPPAILSEWRGATRQDVGAEVVSHLEGAPVTATFFAGEGGESPRGSIKLQLDPNGRPREFAIQVLNGDKSTFLHETAHFLSWSLHDIATSDLATPELKGDYTELLKWAGYDSTEQRLAETTERAELSSKEERTPEEQRRLTALSAKEERISHGWEQYLFEGKAPSSALGRVFTRFKNWMVGIYQGVAGLQAQYRAQYGQELGLSDNVRAIFDRLLAQDDALKQAQDETGAPVAPTPEALANMSPTEAAAYRRALDRASFASDSELNRRAAEIQSKQMDGARERVQAEVTQKVDAQPVYRAWRYLETGQLVDENGQVQATAPFPETYKLSREQFTKEYGKDAAKKLPRQLFGATKKAGVSSDELAPLLGFNSGDELAKQLTQAIPRDRAIAQQVQGQLNSEYGPVLQGIQDAAMASVHNDAAAHAMLLELRGLAKDVDPATRNRVSSMSLETLKATAADIVSATTVGELDPARYARTERQTALKAAELLGRGKKEEALDQKEARLLNQVLYREARDASEQLDKVHDKLEGTSDSIRANLGKADPAYRDAHDQLLAAVGLGESGGVADPGVLDALLKRADADAQDVAFDVDRIRQLINQPKDWEQLTVDDARAVADAVTNIRHIARETLDIQLEGKKVEKAAFMQSVADRVASVRPAQPAEPYSRTAEGIGTKLRAARRGALTMLEDVETWAEMMDGGTEGPAHQLLIGARLEARASEAKLQAEVLKPIKKLWDEMPKEIQKVRAEKVNVGDLLPVPEKAKSLVSPTYTRDQLWSLFLNWGNEGNRQRIRDGNGWTDANVNKALGLLAKPELKFLQGVLDTIDSLYPELAKSYEKRTGLTLDRVASTPIELNGETYRGGYFPLKYDARFAKAGEVQEGQVVKSLFQPNYVKPTVASSHTKSRVERVDQPVDLTWGTVPAHLSQVVHDISYGDWVRQAGGILLDPRFQAPVTQFLGPERAKQFVPWLRDVANNRVDSSAGYVSDFMRNAENFGRSRLALASIGLNIPALARHTFDPWTALADSEGVRPQHIIGGYLKVMNPANWNAMPEFGLSKEIAYRDTMHEENLRTELAKISPKQEGAMRRIITSVAFKGSAWMDHFTSRVIFKAAYDQGIADGLNEQDAAKRGDDVVRRSLPAGDIAEKPPILRTKQGLASAVMFYGYASKMYNLRARAFDAAWRSWNSETEQPADKAMAIATVAAKFMAVGAVSALGSYFAGRGWKKDEDPVAWTGSEVALSPLDDIPLVGPMVKKALTGHKVNVAAAPTMALVGEWLEKVGDMAQHHTGSQRESDQIWGAVQGVLSAFGPAGQVGRTVGYLKKVDSGESRPRGLLDVAGGLIYGEGKNPSVNPLTDLQGAVQ